MSAVDEVRLDRSVYEVVSLDDESGDRESNGPRVSTFASNWPSASRHHPQALTVRPALLPPGCHNPRLAGS